MRKLLFLLLVLYSGSVCARNWELRKQEGNMKIYTGPALESKVKALRVEYIVDATMTQLVALLLDTEAQPKWVYSTKSSYLLKQLSPTELMTYSEKILPNPFSNRDLVTKVTLTQDPATRVLTINVVATPNFIPEKKGLVRVPFAKVLWTVTPISANRIGIEYIAEAEAGGSIPAWVANLFLLKGPYESFRNLSVLIQQPQYKNANISFIKD